MDHISYSQGNMLLKCGIQYEFRYVKGIKIPPNGALTRGKCGHKAIELNFRQKIETEVDLPKAQVVQAYVDQFEKEKYNIQYSEEEVAAAGSPGKAEGMFKDTGVAMVGVYHDEISPQLKPLAVEEPFRVDFEGDFPGLTGIIDLRERDQSIVDSKFVGKTPSPDDIKTDVQLQTYQLGCMVRFRRKPTKVKKAFAVSTKVPKTVLQIADPYPDDTITRVLNRYEAAIKAIKTGGFAPAPAGVWWCSPKWCGYWKLCKYHP